MTRDPRDDAAETGSTPGDGIFVAQGEPETPSGDDTPEDAGDTADAEDAEAAPPAPARRPPRPGVLDEREERLPVEQLGDPDRLISVIQSLLLAADRPLTPAQLATLAGGERVDPLEVQDLLDEWRRQLDRAGAGIRVLHIGGGYRLRTADANAPWVRAFTRRRPVRLSRAALETLAIVAYRQPVTRAEVDDVRGVDSSVVLRSLLEKDLVRISGRKEEPGRPMLYATSRRFLDVFGLTSLAALPSLREFGELAIGEQEQLFGDHELLEGGDTADSPGGGADVAEPAVTDGGSTPTEDAPAPAQGDDDDAT